MTKNNTLNRTHNSIKMQTLQRLFTAIILIFVSIFSGCNNDTEPSGEALMLPLHPNYITGILITDPPIFGDTFYQIIASDDGYLYVCSDMLRLKVVKKFKLPGEYISHSFRSKLLSDSWKTSSGCYSTEFLKYHFYVSILCKTPEGNLLVVYGAENTGEPEYTLKNPVYLKIKKINEYFVSGNDIVHLIDRELMLEPIIYIQTEDRTILNGYYIETGEYADKYVFEKPVVIRKQQRYSEDSELHAFDEDKMIQFHPIDKLSESSQKISHVFFGTNADLDEVIISGIDYPFCRYYGYYDGKNIYLDERRNHTFDNEPDIKDMKLIDKPLYWAILPTDDGLYFYDPLYCRDELTKIADGRFKTIGQEFGNYYDRIGGSYFVYQEVEDGYNVFCIRIDTKMLSNPKYWDIWWLDYGIIDSKPLYTQEKDLSFDLKVVLFSESHIYEITENTIKENSKLLFSLPLKEDIE